MNCEDINSYQSYNIYLWNNRIEDHLIPKIEIKFVDDTITVDEFILRDNFKTYELLKDKFVGDGIVKELDFSHMMSVIDNICIEYKYFKLIIKYLYGFEFDFEGISLNELYKIHLFLTKHCNDNMPLKSQLEDRIHFVLFQLPFININGEFNNDENYKKKCNVGTCNIPVLVNTIKKYKYYPFIQKYFTPYFLESNSWNKITLELPHKIIKNTDEIFDKYKEYLLDDEIYDYALSHIFNKYDIGNDKYIPKLPDRDIKIQIFNEKRMMEDLGYYNLMKYKYYTLSFLNKNFAKINLNNILDGYYNKYKSTKNLYTIDAILKCAKLAKNDEIIWMRAKRRKL